MVINRKKAAVVALTLTSGFVGSAAGYLYTMNKFMDEININKTGISQESAEDDAEAEVVEAASKEEKITPSTKMVYRYNFADDGVTEEVEEEPSYFLIDLTLSDLLKYYSTWDIVSFSSKEVVMEKTIYGPSMQRYVVGVNLKEITSIPVDALSEEERLRLTQGIKVIGKDSLARVLEDYSS